MRVERIENGFIAEFGSYRMEFHNNYLRVYKVRKPLFAVASNNSIVLFDALVEASGNQKLLMIKLFPQSDIMVFEKWKDNLTAFIGPFVITYHPERIRIYKDKKLIAELLHREEYYEEMHGLGFKGKG